MLRGEPQAHELLGGKSVKREAKRIKSENPFPPITHHALRITKTAMRNLEFQKRRDLSRSTLSL